MGRLDLLELGVAFYEFLGAAAGEGDGEAAVVFITFDSDDGAYAVFGVADFLADERIGTGSAADGAAETGLRASARRLGLANCRSVTAADALEKFLG